MNAAVNTNNATAWNPNADGDVHALAVAGSIVYAGGAFTSIGGLARNRIAALNAGVNTNNATSWNPNVTGTSGVHVKALAFAGSTVYAGGFFTGIGGQLRQKIGAIDAASGLPTDCRIQPGTMTPQMLRALAVSGSTVFAGGTFTAIGGQTRNRIAALDANLDTNNATAWNPNANGSVNVLSVSGSTVYAGGAFTSIGGQLRNRLGGLDSAVNTNNATSFDPNASGEVKALALSPLRLVAGGSFTSMGLSPQSSIAFFEDHEPRALSVTKTGTGEGTVISVSHGGSKPTSTARRATTRNHGVAGGDTGPRLGLLRLVG